MSWCWIIKLYTSQWTAYLRWQEFFFLLNLFCKKNRFWYRKNVTLIIISNKILLSIGIVCFAGTLIVIINRAVVRIWLIHNLNYVFSLCTQLLVNVGFSLISLEPKIGLSNAKCTRSNLLGMPKFKKIMRIFYWKFSYTMHIHSCLIAYT